MDPKAAAQVRDVDDTHDKVTEGDEIILSLLGLGLKDDPHDHVEWLHEHADVHKAPKKLEPVELVTLFHEQAWHSADKVEYEGAGEGAHIVVGDSRELSEGSGLFDETE